MTKNRVNFGYLSYNDMIQKISDGILNQYDIIFTKDTFETYVISEELEPKPIRSKVYTFASVTEAIQKLNKHTDTYVGQLVSILNGDVYKGYIVNQKNGSFTVTSLSQMDFVDYNTLGNKPIVNVVGESDNPIIISNLENGTYSVTGHFKIALNDVTIHLNPNATIFIIEHDENSIFVKKIATKEIVDYEIVENNSVVVNQYITKKFLEENGYVTSTYVDEKIIALDFIKREEMVMYVEELFQTFIYKEVIPIVDDRIDKKIIGATREQIYSLFTN